MSEQLQDRKNYKIEMLKTLKKHGIMRIDKKIYNLNHLILLMIPPFIFGLF